VITLFPNADEDLADRKLKVQLVGRAEVTSLNEVKIPAAACNGNPCDPGTYCAMDACIVPLSSTTRGILGWILLIGGIALGGMVVLGLIGFVMTKRQELAARMGDTSLPQGITGVVPAQTQAQLRQTFSSQPPPKTQALMPGGAMPGPMMAGTPRIHVTAGPYAGRELPLKHGFFVGKNQGCDLLVDDGYTSGHHAQFVFAGDKVQLYDFGSTNGTFVNGQRITHTTLEHGATIKIGSTEMRFLAQ
jgi:hypothetical protein